MQIDSNSVVEIVLVVILIISEVLPFIPQKFIKANGIIELIVEVIKKIAERNKRPPSPLATQAKPRP